LREQCRSLCFIFFPPAGGACGFKHVNRYPFMSMGSCGNQPLFKDGKGCGSCYKVKRKSFSTE
jgi:hypothetical protein